MRDRLKLMLPAKMIVVPAAAVFVERYAGVEFDFVLLDAIVDLLDRKLDMVVRIGERTCATQDVSRRPSTLRLGSFMHGPPPDRPACWREG